MRVLSGLAAALALLGVAAGPIEVPEAARGEPGDWIVVKAQTKGKTVKWVAVDPGLKVFPADLLKSSHSAVVTAAKPGRYRLLAFTAVDGEPTDPVVTTVVVGQEGVVPPPGPGPTPPGPTPPPAPPQPGTKDLWLVIVEESGARTPETARVLADTALWLSLAGRGHDWRFYDKDNPAAAQKGYLKHAERVGLPALLVLGRDGGEPLAAVKLPATAAGVDQAVKAAGGK